MKTTLRRIEEMDTSDFSVSRADYEEMLQVQLNGITVEVNKVSSGYYDIILPNSRVVYSMSWYHLTGVKPPFAK